MYIGSDQILKYDTYADLPATAGPLQFARTLDSRVTYEFDAVMNMWVPLSRSSIKASNVTINAKNTGSTLVYTLEQSNLNFHPTQIVMRPVAVSGATLKPIVTVGTNSTSYDNIANSTLIGGLLSLTGIIEQPVTVSLSPGITGGTSIYVRVATAALAVNFSFQVDILGYYRPSVS